MRCPTGCRYGVRAMLDLALNFGKRPILLKDIARRQEVSEKYLQHSISALRKAGLVRSIRGAYGGYILAKSPPEIRLSEIIEVLEGSMAPVECVDNPQICERANFCVARDIWVKVKKAIDDVLESITLQDMVEQQKKKESMGVLPINID